MSTVAQVRAVWSAAIWAHTTVTAITSKIYDYNLLAILSGPNLGQTDVDKAYDTGLINFFQYLVAVEAKNDRVGGGTTVRTKTFDVLVSYFKQHDIPDTAHNAVIDNLEVVDGLVVSQLGSKWSATVHHWDVVSVSAPTLIAIQDRPVWQGQILYRAESL